jgi:small subunit ribosomal protein S6
MALYESVFIVRQDVTAAQVDTLADDFAKIIQDGGGAVERREYWGLRNLQYRIKKNRKGHYVLFNMDAPSASVVEMERNMRLNEDVLRYLTTRIDEARPEPSPIMQGKGDRERERADRSSRHGGGRGRGDRPEQRDDVRPAATAPADAPADAPVAAPVAAPAEEKPAEPETKSEAKED